MKDQQKAIANIFAENSTAVPYRPRIGKMLGSTSSAILLQQMMHHGRDGAFYKFKEPCKNKMYKDGDSWCEELGWGRKQFDSALKVFGFKMGGGKKKLNEVDKDKAFVHYYRDTKNTTWWEVKWDILSKALMDLYQLSSHEVVTIVPSHQSDTSLAKPESKPETSTETSGSTPEATHPALDFSLRSKQGLEGESCSEIPTDSQDCESPLCHEDGLELPEALSIPVSEGVREPDTPPAKPVQEIVTWLTAYNDIWKKAFGGNMCMGEAAARFKKVETDHGREKSLAGWEVHCRDEGKYAGVTRYAKKPFDWMPVPAQDLGLTTGPLNPDEM